MSKPERPQLKPKTFGIEIKVGLFLLLGVGVTAASILLLGSNDPLFTRMSTYRLKLPTADGLIPGAKVLLAGLHVGTVQDVIFDPETRDITVKLGVQAKYSEYLRTDSAAEVATQGMLGDRYVQLTPGTQAQPKLPGDGLIPQKPGRDLNQFIDKGDKLLFTLTQIATGVNSVVRTFEANGRSETLFQGMAVSAKNLAMASEKLNKEVEDLQLKKISRAVQGILDKVNNGTGTLGALVNDPELYDDAKALFGGANRSRVVRNLVRQTVKSNTQKKAADAKGPASTDSKSE